ncbi:hypothetical protein T4D_16609 [Trichinella pseudospiralis]|uniref:Uncharacterized protein n=1 Tax=Trichinella pseudospiralis TaxID=6337 RepID=A0A0V1G0L6_TRIPS|nr:hypothetical protein T4D_16609 [Trichinella pseudospiralis]
MDFVDTSIHVMGFMTLMQAKNGHMQKGLAIWALSLQEYDYNIKYRLTNENAHALSKSTVSLCALAIQPAIPMNVILQE